MMPGGQIVRPLGLQLDVDVTEDVREAIRLGYLPSPASLLFEHDHLSPPQPGGKV
jgi:hypothetical protein